MALDVLVGNFLGPCELGGDPTHRVQCVRGNRPLDETRRWRKRCHAKDDARLTGGELPALGADLFPLDLENVIEKWQT
jgi:hypothetical protein